ncbi:hypothetical protein ACGFIY_10220 [Micromonospora chersina]|uniref:hypothetical protein n=1 Tax=Micromonospora chersina TaxID=47854 RepID=UPI00371D56D8
MFTQILRRHGVEQDCVTDVAAAWDAFAEFLQLDIAGLDPTLGSDADGFIVQWGRRSWSDNRLILTFTRQLAITDVGDHDDSYPQPELWQLDLEMTFADAADLIGHAQLAVQDTGFTFAPTGPLRATALVDTWTETQQHAPVRAAWVATPASSRLSFECVC